MQVHSIAALFGVRTFESQHPGRFHEMYHLTLLSKGPESGILTLHGDMLVSHSCFCKHCLPILCFPLLFVINFRSLSSCFVLISVFSSLVLEALFCSESITCSLHMFLQYQCSILLALNCRLRRKMQSLSHSGTAYTDSNSLSSPIEPIPVIFNPLRFKNNMSWRWR